MQAVAKVSSDKDPAGLSEAGGVFVYVAVAARGARVRCRLSDMPRASVAALLSMPTALSMIDGHGLHGILRRTREAKPREAPFSSSVPTLAARIRSH